ncbi:MAG TPA: response regulator transcription factor [Blastocatellia bacterium]|nr:response regulator transcription factor [Blastocatellia bacterium]
MIKILIADDHTTVRTGLKQILVEEADVSEVGEARNAHEAIDLVRSRRWDLVVTDISMPGRGGLELLKEIKSEQPKLPVLVLSMHPEEQYAVRALKAGASGYMSKEAASDELVKAVRKILRGGRYISDSVADLLAADIGEEAGRPRYETLSDREYQVMIMIASGKAVSDIAAELALSVKTISTYRARVLEKMGMKNNAELTHYAIQNRLVE